MSNATYSGSLDDLPATPADIGPDLPTSGYRTELIVVNALHFASFVLVGLLFFLLARAPTRNPLLMMLSVVIALTHALWLSSLLFFQDQAAGLEANPGFCWFQGLALPYLTLAVHGLLLATVLNLWLTLRGLPNRVPPLRAAAAALGLPLLPIGAMGLAIAATAGGPGIGVSTFICTVLAPRWTMVPGFLAWGLALMAATTALAGHLAAMVLHARRHGSPVLAAPSITAAICARMVLMALLVVGVSGVSQVWLLVDVVQKPGALPPRAARPALVSLWELVVACVGLAFFAIFGTSEGVLATLRAALGRPPRGGPGAPGRPGAGSFSSASSWGAGPGGFPKPNLQHHPDPSMEEV